MIRCPNCGSTAQIRLKWADGEMQTNEIYKEYECGCGCAFIVTYKITDVKILNEKA